MAGYRRPSRGSAGHSADTSRPRRPRGHIGSAEVGVSCEPPLMAAALSDSAAARHCWRQEELSRRTQWVAGRQKTHEELRGTSGLKCRSADQGPG